MRVTLVRFVVGLALALAAVGEAAEAGGGPAVSAGIFTNMDFELGAPGEMPTGWYVPKVLAEQGFVGVLTTNQPKQGLQCAEIRWPQEPKAGANTFANLMQSIDATPWRGARIKVTAAVRVASAENRQRAQMWFRVDCPNGIGAFDNMQDRPIVSTNWADYSITADVADDAKRLVLGLMTHQGATAWWDDIRIERVTEVGAEGLEELQGKWKGSLEVGPVTLRVFFVFEKQGTRRIQGYFVSPDQSETQLPVTRMELTGDLVNLAVASVNGFYTGKLDRVARTMVGTWKQGPASLPLALAFTDADWNLRRPQSPQPPFPYRSEDVVFKSHQASLAGTLTEPEGRGPFPALILITGSGPQDRDETLFGHKPFGVLADFLSRNGYAVLRYDDRGVGKSTGDFQSATSQDFSYDAEAAFDFLKTRPEIDPKRIGFAGHSEGGMIAPMIAARRSDVAFLILLAAPGITGQEIALAQSETFSRQKGFSEESIVKCRPLSREMLQMLQSSRSTDELKAKFDDLEQRMLPLMEEKDRQLYAKLKAVRQSDMEFGLANIRTSWTRFLLRYDPAGDLGRVKCPVLALNGQLDTQVLAAQNLPAIEKGIRAGGNGRVTVCELKGLNHLFQTAKTGELKEYGEIEETFAPVALAKILEWLKGEVMR